MINDDCLNELLSYTERDDVGITGARLLYEDNTVQHAGVVIGYNGLAGHTFVGNEPDDVGYRAYVIQARDYSAVTAACLMVKASLYDEVGGFEEELEVAFNDVDLSFDAAYTGLSNATFTVKGIGLSRNRTWAGLGILTEFNPNFAWYANYDGKFEKGKLNNNVFTTGVRINID